jgi:hypothetical protein
MEILFSCSRTTSSVGYVGGEVRIVMYVCRYKAAQIVNSKGGLSAFIVVVDCRMAVFWEPKIS